MLGDLTKVSRNRSSGRQKALFLGKKKKKKKMAD